MIQITTPAADRNLLTPAQLRRAAGVEVNSDALTEMGLRASDAISRTCRVVSDGVNVPTLLSEGVTEVRYLNRSLDVISLARGPVTSIASVTAGGVVLDPSQYMVTGGRLLHRLENDMIVNWSPVKTTIVYTGGHLFVPPDLALAASQYIQFLWFSEGRDPSKKLEWIDGMGKDEWFEGDGAAMAQVEKLIAPYLQYGV